MVAKSENNELVLRRNIPLFAGQITGANPAIPGMFPNMFPLATSQVFFYSFFPALVVQFEVNINFTLFLFLSFFKLQPFSALPVMPVQAMTQQVKMLFSEMKLHSLLFNMTFLDYGWSGCTEFTGYTTC